MTKQEKTAVKVRKLLAISRDGNASEAEIQNAMNHAHRLMGEYHLSEEDLGHEPQTDYDKIDEAECNRNYSFIGKKAFQWECSLAFFVSDFVGVPFFLRHKSELVNKNGITQFDQKQNPRFGKAFVFYGLTEDAAIASELYDELRLLIATMAVSTWGSVYKGDGAVYSQGFVEGLKSQLEKTKTIEHQETSTVLVHRRDDLIKYKEKKAKQFLSTVCKIKLSSRTGGTGASGSNTAYRDGKSDGSKASVSSDRSKKIC